MSTASGTWSNNSGFSNLCLGLVKTLNTPEKLDLFHAAVFAFELRFERELTHRWQRLESDTADAIASTPSGIKKYLALSRFFTDAGEQVAEVVRLYFPKLLQVATAGRHNLGSQAPLEWTQERVLSQACGFLGVEEIFMENSPPRDDSRVLRCALRVSTNTGWLYDDSAFVSCLPAWVESHWGLSRVLKMGDRDAELSASDLEPLSLVETQNWVRAQEFRIHRRLERQIQDDSFEGVIEAGKTGISILDPFRVEAKEDSRVNEAPANVAHDQNLYMRDGSTWVIEFEEEHCSLPEVIGLTYIAILLERPLREVRASELLSIAGGFPVFPHNRSQALLSLAEDSTGSNDPDNAIAPEQLQSGREDVLDATALREIQKQLTELKGEIALSISIGDTKKAAELERELSEIQQYVKGSLNFRGRPREFADETEKARQSITQALIRAFKKIQVQSPKTASHLEEQIEKGSKFMYRDGTARWRVVRNP